MVLSTRLKYQLSIFGMFLVCDILFHFSKLEEKIDRFLIHLTSNLHNEFYANDITANVNLVFICKVKSSPLRPIKHCILMTRTFLP